MPNIQQPEMRRSGKDPLVQDSAELRAGGAQGAGGHTGPVPPDQQSPYGPQPGRRHQAEPAVPDAILVGGPAESTAVQAEDAALVTVEMDGLTHRYARTSTEREADGLRLVVYNYDGVVRES